MSKYTPGPWREGRIGSHCILQGSDGTYIGKVDEFKAYDVDHFLECVNNCEGINPEALPRFIRIVEHVAHRLRHDTRNIDGITKAAAADMLMAELAAIARVGTSSRKPAPGL